MLRSAMHSHKPRAPPQWRMILARIKEQRWREVDEGDLQREGEHPLEAMVHWRDPTQRLRTHRRRRMSLLDDNPSSG
jgi:hypothetical protein